MRSRLPHVIIFLLFFLLWATPVSALHKWGVHLSNDRDPGLLIALRQRYSQAGITDWVPVTVLLPVGIGSDELAGFLDGCKNNKFWPILRVFNDGHKILKNNVDQLVPTLISVQSRLSAFPESVYLVFGNEVNNGENEWGNDNANPQEYTESLRYFIDQIRLKAPAFKVGNAALNTSMPSNLLPKNYPAEKFWKEGPKSLVNDLDVLVFNTYEINSASQPSSIKSWIWEWELLGPPGSPPEKPIILTEYGFWPDGELADRENYVNLKYKDYLNDLERGNKNDLDRVTAITPLFWTEGAIKIPVFGSSGSVTWYDPDNIYSGEPVTTPGSATVTPAISPGAADGLRQYISQLVDSFNKASNTDKNVRNLACGQLPVALCNGSDNVVSSNFNQNVSVLGVQDAGVSQDTNTVVGVVQDYNTLAAVSENSNDYSARNLESFFSNLFNQIMTLIGFGHVRSKEKLESTATIGMMNDVNMGNAFVKGVCEEVTSQLCNGLGNVLETPAITSAITPGGSGGSSDDNCPVGSGYCSVENLMKKDDKGNYIYFSDVVSATKASKICQRESGSNPISANKGCLTGKYVDYSIGLFQINILAHCPLSLPTYTWQPPSCSFGNIAERDKCEELLKDPDYNIKYAVQLSNNGTNWKAWAAAGSAYCNIQ
ncbi:hypothetical protein MUP32_03990 [Candidatus Microgenomates bacterium]|nr:hypothetical protein [Candidatus Microgenomates bacterium]